MIYKTGTKMTCKDDGHIFIVTESTVEVTKYRGPGTSGECPTPLLADQFIVEGEPLQTVAEHLSALDVPKSCGTCGKATCSGALGVNTCTCAPSALDVQEGAYQPWEVLRRWLTPEEFRGYMKGTAIAYLARERDKGGMVDISKAGHTLEGLVELLGAE